MTGWVRLSDAERRATRLLRPRDVAVQYGITTAVQAELRQAGTGPPMTRIGHRWFVQRDLLEAWIASHTEMEPVGAESQLVEPDPQTADSDPPQLAEPARGP